jgi:hypothetical protein
VRLGPDPRPQRLPLGRRDPGRAGEADRRHPVQDQVAAGQGGPAGGGPEPLRADDRPGQGGGPGDAAKIQGAVLVEAGVLGGEDGVTDGGRASNRTTRYDGRRLRRWP